MSVDYGTGADGALHYDGVSVVAGVTPVANVYQLTANVNASSIVIDGGVTIFAANWQIFCAGSLTGAGSTTSKIHCNGFDGPYGGGVSYGLGVPAGHYASSANGNVGQGASAGTGLPSNYTQPGYAAAGTGGVLPTPATDGQDGQDAMKGGGGGGVSTTGQGGGGITGGAIAQMTDSYGYDEQEQKDGYVTGNSVYQYNWGSGGGYGTTGAAGTFTSGTIDPQHGNGGGAGACLYVAAKNISGVRLSANGGRGSDAIAGNKYTTCGGSGGGGGGGGVVILHYSTKTDTVTEALGGVGGLGAAFGTGIEVSNGGKGFAGYTFLYFVASVTSLTITPKPVQGFVGDLIPMTVVANYNDGTTVDVTATATYSTTDATYATVTSAGVVHLLAQGSPALLVQAVYGGFSASASIIVSSAMTSVFWWGPLDPDASHGYQAYWGPMFPDYLQPNVLPPSGPTGVANFQLDLESGSKITLSWLTDVVKTYDGKEYRANIIDEPKVKFDGTAILIGDDTRAMRSILARSAASGQPFTLGLPYEEMTVIGNGATAQQILVQSTAGSDWAHSVGQSVIVFSPDEHETARLAVVQPGGGANFIQVDADVSAVARRGARVMPAVSILLEANQGFARYPGTDAVETWQLRAVAYDYGFRAIATRASKTMATATGFTNQLGSLVWTVPGAFANGYRLTLVNDGTSFRIVSSGINEWTIHYSAGTFGSSVSGVVSLLRSVGFDVTASFINLHWLMAAGDAGDYYLTGGTDAAVGLWGSGGTVEYLGTAPIWDRYLQVETTASDSIQSMTEIVDWDGVPISIGQAKYPDWGRAIRISREIQQEWAWLKAFLFTVAGRFRSFYLPTWRPDLKFHSAGIAGSYFMRVKNNTIADGDFFAWYPKNKYIQIVEADNTVNRFLIDGAVDNNDGTVSITSGGFVYSGTPRMISWVELCRFESDDFEITFEGVKFTMDASARVVQQ